jgi:hypothetical protein
MYIFEDSMIVIYENVLKAILYICIYHSYDCIVSIPLIINFQHIIFVLQLLDVSHLILHLNQGHFHEL